MRISKADLLLHQKHSIPSLPCVNQNYFPIMIEGSDVKNKFD